MNNVDGVILAAGRSSRMETGHKVHATLGKHTLLQHVIMRLEPQVDSLVINADPDICGQYSQPNSLPTSHPIVADRLEGFRGPLMGLYTGLTNHYLSSADYLLSVPCDGPFIPPNLASELQRQIRAGNADIACVRYAGQIEPMFSLWHKRTVNAVEQALLDNQGGFKSLFAELQTVYLDWPEQSINPFFNINTVDDLAEAERLL
jgi:molybdopterin-guanine dinucleotide biosynthesis protein A